MSKKKRAPETVQLLPRVAMALGLAPDTRNRTEQISDELDLRTAAVKYDGARWW